MFLFHFHIYFMFLIILFMWVNVSNVCIKHFQCWNIHRSEKMYCLLFWDPQSSFYVIFNVRKIDFSDYTQKILMNDPQKFQKKNLNWMFTKPTEKKINRFVLFLIDLCISHYFRGYMIILCIFFYLLFFCSTKTPNSLKCENNL